MDTRPHIAIFGLLLIGAVVQAEVVKLTDATYPDKIKEQDTLWFIEFFAPWCGHCKRLAPIWQELGKAIEGADGIEVAQVDCTTSKATCEKAGVSAYPTLKLFYNGEEYKKYSGQRDLESLKKFATDSLSELANAAEKTGHDDLNEFSENKA